MTRGWAAIVLSVVFFAAASVVSVGVSGRGGVALASVWVFFMGSYCALNFLLCRETHCLITGTGWQALSLAGLVAALTRGPGISWFGVNVEVGAFVVILGLGYALGMCGGGTYRASSIEIVRPEGDEPPRQRAMGSPDSSFTRRDSVTPHAQASFTQPPPVARIPCPGIAAEFSGGGVPVAFGDTASGHHQSRARSLPAAI